MFLRVYKCVSKMCMAVYERRGNDACDGGEGWCGVELYVLDTCRVICDIARYEFGGCENGARGIVHYLCNRVVGI